MIHDPDLLDRLDALPKETFDGEVFRGTRQSLDPLASSYSGGRWMRRDGAGVLYTSLAREGALAEISSTGVSWTLNLILFPDQMGVDASLEVVGSEIVDWVAWATVRDLLQ